MVTNGIAQFHAEHHYSSQFLSVVELACLDHKQ